MKRREKMKKMYENENGVMKSMKYQRRKRKKAMAHGKKRKWRNEMAMKK